MARLWVLYRNHAKGRTMAVLEALGIESLVDDASQSWGRWTAPEPALHRFGCVEDVALWRWDAPTQETREVLLALGRLTLLEESRSQAMPVLAHLLAPVCEAVVSRRLAFARVNGSDEEELSGLAAGYLWEELAGYPWVAPLLGNVPLAIARGVARSIDRECGWGDRGDRVWRQRSYYETYAATFQDDLLIDRMPQLSYQEVLLQTSEVLWWAISEALVSRSEMELLVQLAVAAADDKRRAGSCGGLTALPTCETVGKRIGASGYQVRRRAERTLGQLRAAV